MAQVYPEYDYNQGQALLTHLGSFWERYFGDADKLQTFLRSSGHEMGQTYIDFLAAVAHLSRFTIPVFHTDIWYLLILKRSEVNSVTLRYDEGAVYGKQSGTAAGHTAGEIYTYDGPGGSTYYEYPIPDTLKYVPYAIFNRVITPSKSWFNGIDYEIDREKGIIRFREDPFSSNLVSRRYTYDSTGSALDEEVGLWCFNSEWDLDYITTQFGYVLDLALESSEFYKDFVNAYWDMLVGGPSVTSIRNLLAALSGAAVVVEARETVEVVQLQDDALIIVTDLTAYRFPITSTSLVAVGDVVYAGDSLVDTVQVVEISGESWDVDVDTLPAMSLGTEFLSGGYFGSLTFENKTVTLDWQGIDGDNKAIVRFEISGFPGDIDLFWETADTEGKTSQMLSEMLDTRTNPSTPPYPQNLPATINPLQFVMEHLFRNNMFLIKVKISSFNSEALGLGLLRKLRDVIPPHTTFIVFVEMRMDTEAVDLTDTVELTDAFIGDTLSDTAEEVTEAGPGYDGLTYGDTAITARLISVTCK